MKHARKTLKANAEATANSVASWDTY